MTQYEAENPFVLLYRHSDRPYMPAARWCVTTDFELEKIPQINPTKDSVAVALEDGAGSGT